MENKIKGFEQFLNENISPKKEVIDFLQKQMLEDKKSYKGNIPSKYNPGSEWSDFSWIVDEIYQFLNKDYTSSYTLKKFTNKYDYGTLDNILKNAFESEYEHVLTN